MVRPVFLVCALICSVFGAAFSYAQDESPLPTVTYTNNSEIPKLYRESMHGFQHIDAYKAYLHRRIKSATDGKTDNYVAADREVDVARKCTSHLENKHARLLKMDLNKDGVILFDEMYQFELSRHDLTPEVRKDLLNSVQHKRSMDFARSSFGYGDANRDGIVDAAEMQKRPAYYEACVSDYDRKWGSEVDFYMDLDYNNDGYVTVKEINIGADAAYAVYDTNLDSIVSVDEFHAARSKK